MSKVRLITFSAAQACVALAGVSAEPYTLGQLYAGVPAYRAAVTGQPGIITHISYPSTGYTPGYTAGVYGLHHGIYKREAEAEPYTLGQLYAGVPAYRAAVSGQPGVITHVEYPSAYGYGVHRSYGLNLGYGLHHGLYKREAEAYTPAQVAYGKPIADAIATGHAHNPGYPAYTSYSSYAPHHFYGAYGLYPYGK